MKKLNKLALGSLSTLLLTTSLATAQTTVGGDMRLGLKATSSDAKHASNTVVTKETQINLTNAGNLNFGGGKYVAGFSVEFDGVEGNNRSASVSSLTAGTHFENNYINFVFGDTLLHFGNDHLKPTNVNLTDIAGVPTPLFQSIALVGASGTAATGAASIARQVLGGLEKGDGGRGFGFGIRQTFPGIGAFSAVYNPNADGSNAMPDTGDVAYSHAEGGSDNSFHSIGFRGNFGIKGLDFHTGYNSLDSSNQGAAQKADQDVLTFGVSYRVGDVVVALDKTQMDYNVTGSQYDVKGIAVGYLVNKDLTIQLSHYRSTDSTATSTSTEKVQGITIARSLGPVGLTVVAGTVENSNGIALNDGKMVHATLGLRF